MKKYQVYKYIQQEFISKTELKFESDSSVEVVKKLKELRKQPLKAGETFYLDIIGW